MRWLVFTSCLLLTSITCIAEPIHALRFEGNWKLDGPDPARSRIDFRVNGERIAATFYHPAPSALSDIHIDGDTFTAWYLDEFGSRVGLTAQLKGSELRVAITPDGRPLRMYSGARVAPEPGMKASNQKYSGSFHKTEGGGTGEITAGDHTYVFSGTKEGNCVNVSAGKDGNGVAFNTCVSVSKTKDQ